VQPLSGMARSLAREERREAGRQQHSTDERKQPILDNEWWISIWLTYYFFR